MEPLLDPDNKRLVLLPIQNADIWDFYKKAQHSIWTAEEIDFAHDKNDFAKLNESEREFVLRILAFFASADSLVNINLVERFTREVTCLEALYFYQFQMAIENVHSETYSIMLETLCERPERDHLINAVETIPGIQKKAEWAETWCCAQNSFGERLVAFACVEGIHFSGAFCAIFWLKKRGSMPGLCFSNELIARDEGLHRDFAC